MGRTSLDQPRRQLARWWGGLLLATTLLSLLISVRYFTVTPFGSSGGVLLFRLIMLIGHFSLLCLLLLSPILLLAWLLPRPRWVIATGALWSAAILLTLLIDTQVYQLYRFHLNAGVLNLLLGGAAHATFIFPAAMYLEALLVATVTLSIVATIALLSWHRISRRPARRGRASAYAAALVLCIVGFHATHIWADAISYQPLLQQTGVLPLRYAATAKRFLRARGVEIHARSGFAAHARAASTGLSYPLRPLDCRAPSRPPNILFILIDSWRFDEMRTQVTPRIAAFAPRATRFADHHSGGNATRIGVFSLFYSIPGTYWHQVLNEQRGPVFIDELLRQGYDVRAFRSAPLYSPEFDRTIFANVPSPRLRSSGDGPAAWDRDLTDDFLQFLEARGRSTPFFAFLFYSSPHSFQVPDNYPLVFQPSASHVDYLRLHAHTEQAPLLNRYRNSLHYVDGLIGEVLDAVKLDGLLDDTIIVITGDHGQEFNDSGLNYWGHGSNFTRYQTGIPLLFYVPGREGSLITHKTTHFDVAPTLLRDHLGCTSALFDYSVGRPLLERGGRDTLVLSEYADFAIVQPDRIAVVREQGMQIVDPHYAHLDVPLDPGTMQSALEQKTRFFRSAGWRTVAVPQQGQSAPSAAR